MNGSFISDWKLSVSLYAAKYSQGISYEKLEFVSSFNDCSSPSSGANVMSDATARAASKTSDH
jgi:hypothetical protein